MTRTKTFLFLLACVIARVQICWTASFAVVIMKDGKAIEGEFDEHQSIVLRTSLGDRALAIADVLWLVGDDAKTVRLLNSKTMLSGTAANVPLRIQTGQGDLVLNPQDIVLLLLNPLEHLKAESLFVVEVDEGTVVIGTGPHQANLEGEVLLIPSNWQGAVRLSNLRYPPKISSGEPFTLLLDMQGDDAMYRDVTKRVLESDGTNDLAVFTFFLTRQEIPGKDARGANYTMMTMLRPYAEKGVLPTDKSKKRSVPIQLTIGHRPGSRGLAWVFRGQGTLYLCVAKVNTKLVDEPEMTNDFFQTWGRGKVKVVRSVSNVVKMDVEFEEKTPSSAPAQ